MEKENMFMNLGNSMAYGLGIQTSELNCNAEQLQNCFFNPNWENSTDQSDPFESALSSMVSSPATSNVAGVPGNGGGGENIELRELIGRLGSICNSGEMSPPSYIAANNSTNTSCYSTPLNSPPKLNLSMMDHQIRGNLPFSANNLPSHPSLTQFSADPGFAERAARYSCFANKSLSGLNGQVGLSEHELPQRLAPKLDSGKLPRVWSCQSMKISGSQMGPQENRDASLHDGISLSDRKSNRLSTCSTPENTEFSDSRENSSVSEQIPVGETGMNDANSRKRKSIPRGKAKEIPSAVSAKEANVVSENNESNAKRSKSEEDTADRKDTTKGKAEASGSEKASGSETEKDAGNGNQKQNKDNQKPLEPPKDYIHVRARRGQATDAHSLAERVRREKISERMKLLQDLVPGCNKVTGKAVMLDEIINYVQSLQRQVQFLSMKLATVNPRMDFNMEALLSKDILQSHGSLPHAVYPSDNSASAFPYPFQSHLGPNQHSILPKVSEMPFQLNQLNAAIVRNPSVQLPSKDSFVESASQIPSFWEDDLHSVVQMGFGANQTQNFQGSVPTSQMKVEL